MTTEPIVTESPTETYAGWELRRRCAIDTARQAALRVTGDADISPATFHALMAAIYGCLFDEVSSEDLRKIVEANR